MKKRIFAFLAIFIVLFVSIVPVFAVIDIYNVTFNPNGGTMSITTLEEVDSLTDIYSSLYVPTKSGYIFEGWYYDSGLTQRAYASDSLSSDVTLYAKWTTGGSYTITFNSNGGSSISSYTGTNIPSNVHTASAYKPTKSGYTFDGWYTNSSLTTRATAGAALTGNITLYAKWLHNYTITFNSNGGSSISSYTGASIPSNVHTASAYKPTKSGYMFDGWYTNSSLTTRATAGASLTGNITLYAKWVSNQQTYTITFNSNGGSSISSYTGTNIPADINSNSAYKPTKSGYAFYYWYYDSALTDVVNAGDVLSSNITLYAKWVVVCQIDYFDRNALYDTQYVISGWTFRDNWLDAPFVVVPSGYEFGGWYYDSSFIQLAQIGDSVTSNVTLYAKWSLTTYSVVFELDGGTLSSVGVSGLTEMPDLNALYIPTKSGYTFGGWYLNSSCTNPVSVGSTLSDDVIVFAKWISNAPSSYTVTYYSSSGNALGSVSHSVGYSFNSIDLSLQNFVVVPTGYEFDGWYYDNSYTYPASVGDTLTGDVSLYVRFSQIQCIISYYNYLGDVVLHTISVPYGYEITRNELDMEFSNSVPYGSIFVDWSYERLDPFNSQVVEGDSIISNVDFYPYYYSYGRHTITFNSNGGNYISPYEGYYVPDLQFPVRYGYEFVGWYYDSGLTQRVNTGDMITFDKTVYAKWSYNYIPPADGEKTVRDLLNGMTESTLTTFLTVGNHIGFGGITLLTVLTTGAVFVVIVLLIKLIRG